MKKSNFKVWLSLGLFVLLLLFYTQGIHRWITMPSTLASFLLDMLVFLVLAYLFYMILESYLQAPTRQIESKLDRLDLVQILEKSLIPSADALKKLDLHSQIVGVINHLQEKVIELRDSKAYSETLMKTLQVAIVILDPNLAPIYINDHGLKLFGLNKKDIPRLKLADFVDRRFTAEIAIELKKSNNIANKDYTFELKSGQQLHTSISLVQILDVSNKPKEYIIVISDVTRQKKAEENLQNQISFSQKIFKSIPDIIIITDKDLDVIFTNKKALEMLNLPSVLGRKLGTILSPEALEDGFDKFVRNLIQSADNIKQINVLNPFIQKENYVDLVIEPLKSEEKIIGTIILIKDVTEWRNLTQKLKNLQEFTDKLINASPFAIIAINEENNISLWNQNAERIFRIPFQKAIHRDLYEISSIFINYKDVINEVKVLNKTVSITDTILKPTEDEAVTCNLVFYPIQWEGKNVVVNIEDVSEIKKLEDSLTQAHKMESLGMLTSSIIHDFNNVLSGILGYASLLDKIIYADPKLKKYVSYIISSGEKAASMIRQILEFSKKKLIRAEVIDLNELIDESLVFLQMNLKTITVLKEYTKEKMPIKVDRTKITQILINLIINAKEALMHRPKPEICIQTETKKVAFHSTLLDGHYAVFRIIDNGHGIKEENLEKIFEPFFTTKQKVKGTGIGLATVKEIIEDYSGVVEVESQFDEGSTFTIFLPLHQEVPAEIPELVEIEKETRLSGTVLLIDDEEVIREIGMDMLQTLGLECLTAGNGDDGIQIFKERKDKIDAVILDVEMPGTPGDKVYETLLEIQPDVKILLASGYGKDYLEANVFKEKIEFFMPKPFQLKQLAHKLGQILSHTDV